MSQNVGHSLPSSTLLSTYICVYINTFTYFPINTPTHKHTKHYIYELIYKIFIYELTYKISHFHMRTIIVVPYF